VSSDDSTERKGPHYWLGREGEGPLEKVAIEARDGGYKITSNSDDPVIEYDRAKYKIERDPASTEQVERFKLVRK
jgi:hypothetical protein